MRFTPKYDKGKSVKFGRKRGKVAELQSRIVTESKRVREAELQSSQWLKANG